MEQHRDNTRHRWYYLENHWRWKYMNGPDGGWHACRQPSCNLAVEAVLEVFKLPNPHPTSSSLVPGGRGMGGGGGGGDGGRGRGGRLQTFKVPSQNAATFRHLRCQMGHERSDTPCALLPTSQCSPRGRQLQLHSHRAFLLAHAELTKRRGSGM